MTASRLPLTPSRSLRSLRFSSRAACVRFPLIFMSYSKPQLWQRFQKYYTEFPTLGLALDLSRMTPLEALNWLALKQKDRP